MADNEYFASFVTMKRWLENRNEGKSLAKYFTEHGYKRVGLYGAGELGNLLYAELRDTDIEVAYFVDKNSEGLAVVKGKPVISPEEITKHSPIDALIVTPIGNFNEICTDLIRIAPNVAVVSLRDAVYEL